MARYHPTEDWLASYASGALDEASSVLIATHLTFCPDCRGAVNDFETIGGAMLDALEIGAEEDVSTALNGAAPPQSDDAHTAAHDKPALDGSLAAIAPRPLMRYVLEQVGTLDLDTLPWESYGPGIERAVLLEGPHGIVARLLRSQPGAQFPHHGHGSEELTVVLKGAYRDHIGRYEIGDVQCVPQEVSHQPVIEDGDECIALVVSEKPTIPTGIITRLVQRIIGP